MSLGLSPLLLRPLARVLARIDVDGNRFLRDLGIDDATPGEARIDAARVDAALDRIAAEQSDASFGLTLARHAVSHPLGFFDHLVWPGATVRDAIERSARFFGLLTSRSSLTFAEHDGVAQVTQHVAAGAPRGVVLTDMAFASLVLRARGAADGLDVHAMRFVHPAPDARHPYDDTFGIAVEFGAALDVLELDHAQLERPLGTADPITAAALEAEALKLPGARPPEPFVDAVRAAILRTLLEPESLIANVAEALALSEHTLQLRLEELGTSLRELVDEVRRDLAISLIERGTPLADVASTVGFAGSQAFHKAFVRWTGVPPGSWRSR